MFKCLLANGLWTLSAWPAHRRFRHACRDPRWSQERILRSFLRRNAESQYGRRYGYARISSVEQFQDAVPVVGYEDLVPWIEQILDGKQGVLTREPVVMVEKTSGSVGGAKFVPYTRSLLREFQQAVRAWTFDLFTQRPALLGGAQYWSISPAGRRKEFTRGGLPIGFDEDTEYLGVLERSIVRSVLAVPSKVCRIADMDEFRRVTLGYLTACRHLRFISVWNPSFLTVLMGHLPPGTRPADYWPQLRLISCWTSGVSARFLGELRELFPGVEIQGKGLLSTEGVVSFPRTGHPAPAPAITSHFLEFLDDDGSVHLVDDLEIGRRYQVLITTSGGFARYALGDRVEVVAPGAIDFVGRAGNVSDLCGEKLSESFVQRVLEHVAAQRRFEGFLMLAPEWAQPPHYVLFAETPAAEDLARETERRLRDSVHYDYCRRLGQLGQLEGVPVTAAAERYLKSCETLGQRSGDVKPAWLRREFDWRQRLGVADVD